MGTATVMSMAMIPVKRHRWQSPLVGVRGRRMEHAPSSVDPGLRTDVKGGNVDGAIAVGKLVAERALAAGVTKVVYDRGGYLYHGRVKALADAAREGGLDF